MRKLLNFICIIAMRAFPNLNTDLWNTKEHFYKINQRQVGEYNDRQNDSKTFIQNLKKIMMLLYVQHGIMIL